jgi:predicted CopG family antitoxin
MSKYLSFDPLDIEDDVYQRLSPEDKDRLSDPRIVREINQIRRRKASQILEDEDVNILNFQLFQYALKILHKEKKKKQKEE